METALGRSGSPVFDMINTLESLLAFRAHHVKRCDRFCRDYDTLLHVYKDNAKGKAKNGFVTFNEAAVLSEIRRMASGLLDGLTLQA